MANLGSMYIEFFLPINFITIEKHPSASVKPVINQGCSILKQSCELVSLEPHASDVLAMLVVEYE